jgi:hypothetical protein
MNGNVGGAFILGKNTNIINTTPANQYPSSTSFGFSMMGSNEQTNTYTLSSLSKGATEFPFIRGTQLFPTFPNKYYN